MIRRVKRVKKSDGQEKGMVMDPKETNIMKLLDICSYFRGCVL